jgi:hypothetical protein
MQQISLGSVKTRAQLMRPRDFALLVLNTVGAIIYVWFASCGWATPQVRELHAETAEPFIWALSVIPIVGIFSLINVIWGVVILIGRQWRSGKIWLIGTLIWLVAMAVDFAYH